MIALDLFAGHGWGVACQRLGIEEYGVEIMPEARAIRAANGMRTAYADVWDGLLGDADAPVAALQIASPPCQTFSMAGGGAGRRALDEVLALIDERAYLRPVDLHAFGEKHDPRTALVLTPLAMVARDAPTYVVWEQVPPVRPVWERAAAEMREWGYSVWTGIVNAEQYGVPQTRRRAVLIARADGKEATPPTPTHSRYYSHDPKRLDPGVLPWVSMAEALGWGRQARPSVTVTGGGTETGGAEPLGHLSREVSADDWVARKMMGAGMVERYGKRPDRETSDPAFTLRANGGGNATGGFVWAYRRPSTTVVGSPGSVRVTVTEAAALQSYPADFVWDVMVETPRGPKPITKTKQFLTIGNAVPPLMAEAILKAAIS